MKKITFGKTYEIFEENGIWKTDVKDLGEVDSEKIKNLIKSLTALSAAQFLNEKADRLDKELFLKSDDGKELLKIRLGTLKKTTLPNQIPVSVFLAKTSAYSGNISILESDLNNLKLDEVFKKNQEKK